MSNKSKSGNTGKGTPKFEFKKIATRTFYENEKMQIQVKLVKLTGVLNVGISRLVWDADKNNYIWTPRTVYMSIPVWVKFVNQAHKLIATFLANLSEPASPAPIEDDGCDKPDFKTAHCVTFHQDETYQYQLKVVFLKEKRYISIMRNNWSKNRQRYNWTKKNIFMEQSVWLKFLNDMEKFNMKVEEASNSGISTFSLIYSSF